MINGISRFLRNNNSWIILIGLIFLAYIKILTFRTEYGASYIYVHPNKWNLFFKYLGFLVIVFSPALLFSYLRTKIKNRFTQTNYILLWLLSFLSFPCFWGLSPFTKSFVPVPLEPEVLVIFFMPIIMVLDLISIPKQEDHSNKKFKIVEYVKSPNSLVILLFFCLSLYSTFQLMQINKVEGGFFLVWSQSLLVLSLYYIFYYINHYFLVEIIYKAKGIIYYLFSLVGLVIIFFIPVVLLNFYLPAYRSVMRFQHGKLWVGEDAPLAFWSIHPASVMSLMFATIPLIIIIQWYKQSQKIEELQKEKSMTELSLLKQQINPHFFFNTLNNLYSMSLTKDTHTSEGILQLSDLMRYVIYKGKEETVSLSEEIKYLEDYLKLQQLRIHQNFDLQFDLEIEDPNFQITPLLFIILIENAFKHGIEGAENSSFLHLILKQKGSRISFQCKNSVEEYKPTTSGLGLQNLRRRLQLIYSDRHSLEVKKNNDHYMAYLEINKS